MMRIPHCLDRRPTDGGEVVSLTLRPPPLPPEISRYSFLSEADKLPGPSEDGRIKEIEKLVHHTGSRIRDLLACSIARQPSGKCSE
jgi:hypothetical protein